MILKILTVAALATFEIYVAIPTGFAMKLSPWVIFLASVSGGLVGVFFTAFLSDKIKKILFKNRAAKKQEKKHPMLHRLWEKYGIIGLGFIGTMSVGAPICIALGTALNANLHKLVTWCCIGVLTRCVVFTLIGYYGLKLF